MNRRILASILIALVMFPFALSALDMADGRIQLSLDEKTARFTLRYLVDAARNRYVALLYEQEPRTTFPTLFWNGKTYRLGESPDFRFTVKKVGQGAMIEYRSSFAVVRQTFSLIRSNGSTDSDGVGIDVAIENISGSPAKVGFRFLWDTYLGERARRHFEIDGLGYVSGETRLSGVSIPSRILSPGDSGVSFQIQSLAEGITRPDSIILANWKRINDSGWSFESTPGRGFTLLPYSIDDSAAAFYYEPKDLADGAVRVIRMALGNRADGGFSVARGAAGSSSSDVSPAPQPNDEVLQPLRLSTDPFVTARTDMAALREIIRRIDVMLADGKEPDPTDLAEMKSQLEKIRNHRKGL